MKSQSTGDNSPQIINDCLKIHSASKFYSFMNKRNTAKFTKGEYKKISLLVDQIDYENVILMTRKGLCELFGCKINNINRTLRNIDHLIEYETSWGNDEVPRGYIRIVVNPAYGWKQSDRLTREQAIHKWYLIRGLSETSKKDFYCTTQYQELLDFT
ncbi:hypothetical protein KZO83_04505 [Chromohalobacter sp. TMW 2.2308]|uniref:hypothetical protein n=1 Tax=Chromohalobacter TaxID=42054 RepID=UPI001FFC36E7|nr:MULTISPECIES: hypothetical protein [Chromohalobacter]MCK2041948.1 hypothetical protein [Chromohalobacter moromii]MCT8514096.1 hypothetical protein [Chromohalobacter sp. TMW 2.2271]